METQFLRCSSTGGSGTIVADIFSLKPIWPMFQWGGGRREVRKKTFKFLANFFLPSRTEKSKLALPWWWLCVGNRAGVED